MPYVQSERAILYSLHRGTCSRGLQAGRERELAPGLYELQCGLLEMLISRSEGVCVLQSVVRGLPWFPLSLEAALVTPFYSRREAYGRYMYLLRGVLRQGRHVRALQLVTVAPVVAGAPSSIGRVLVTVCLTDAECRDRVDAMARVC